MNEISIYFVFYFVKTQLNNPELYVMGRKKFKTVNSFRGRRKRKYTKLATETEEASTDNMPADRPIPSTCSATAKKMELLGLEISPEMMQIKAKAVTEPTDSFLIVQMSSLNKLFGSVCCPKCKYGGIKFSLIEGKEKGFAVKGGLFCSHCEETIAETFLSERVGGSKSSKAPFEVNVRSTFAFMGVGCGYSAVRDWSTVMNTPSHPSKLAFQNAKQKIISGSRESFEEISKASVEKIREKYAEIGVLPDKDNVLDIAVSYDGSWQRRGHSSHNGLGVVIDLLTGLPIDFEVLCNFCHQCLKAPDKEDPTYAEWIAKHSAKCGKNYDGSANSMEQQCAFVIWKRSVQKYGLRYTTMLSDGDSKSFKHIVEEEVYGKDVTMNKEDCVNHVSKRMGTALKNLKDQCTAQGQSISGKGKLTNEKIVKIQNYYGRAIKDNSEDPELMKQRIFAILFHLTSTDENPRHVHCPPGEKSWCFWKRAEAKQESPGPHKDHETIPGEVGKKLVPIFQRLTEDNLLQRCRRNRTQNPNESLHNLIWQYCPKIRFAGRYSVEGATCMAICQFSLGATFRETLCKSIGIDPGHYLVQGSLQRSNERLKKAEEKSSEDGKKRRKIIKFKRLTKSKKSLAKEGHTYKAGEFD